MSIGRRVWQLAAGAAGVAVAGVAVGAVARQRGVIARRGEGDATAFGSLRSGPVTVIADDGVQLHAEIDEPDQLDRTDRPIADEDALTLVFVHGYALNLDCWHFQRAGYRGLVRAVYFDQRSHGRSERSREGNATIDQLGSDLKQVIDQVVPEGRIVLIGHSMGGMSIMALAEQHPEIFGTRVIGVGLISTTAGGLKPHRMVIPGLPFDLGGQLASRVIAGLSRGSRLVDGVRRVGRGAALVFTDAFAFGDEVPASYVTFVDEMLASTPFEVVAEFFPNFEALDKFSVLSAFERVPTTIICGTDDKLTSIGHSRKMHSLLPGSVLLECEGAGHMVLIERHEQVNAALDQLIAASADFVPLEDL